MISQIIQYVTPISNMTWLTLVQFVNHGKQRVKNSFRMLLDNEVFSCFFEFLSRYQLSCICNSLELEPVILHGMCYILAWSPSMLVFATCWYFKRSGFFRVSY